MLIILLIIMTIIIKHSQDFMTHVNQNIDQQHLSHYLTDCGNKYLFYKF